MIIIIRSEACHKSDNIEFRLWQPLPPFVFDEDGNGFDIVHSLILDREGVYRQIPSLGTVLIRIDLMPEMYQKISQEWGCHIDSVKSNLSLSRMRE